jgi:LuxR family maltose regulon positive regulatory protein
MPKTSLYVLAWSQERQRYELSTHGHLCQSFHSDDNQQWHGWLSEQTSFAFHGRQGQMSVIQEVRPRGAGYWYAYSTHHRHTRKRYLGPTPRVTLERLEQEAEMLAAVSVAQPQKVRQAPREAPGSSPRRGNILLLETRYTLPRLPSTLIRRERLLTVLDAALSHRLLVCSASAGAGKTTLLSAWAAQSPHQVAWLSLDASENEPARFWAAIIVALRHSSPSLSQVGDLALDMVHAAQPPPLSTVLNNLISDVQSCTGEIILILDDYHVIEDRVIQDAMLFLLDHLPANLHLVLSCRVDSALPLSRWRMRGQMIEIHEAELRFTREEASSFLREGMRLSLSEEEVGLLAARTEGWIAGLQLAALSLRTRKNPAASVQNFTGGQRFLLDYVQEEILMHLPLAMQDFLLHIAILERMNAALCQAVTEEPASQEMLERLQRDHLFVIPLDEERQWYRLHTLFRDVLLARLRARQPEFIMDLHQRAAHWYEGEGYTHEAVTHALAAKDYSLAASVLVREAPQLWMQGEARMIATWLLVFPDAVVQERLNFVLTAALHLLWRTQSLPDDPREEGLVKSERLIARVEQILQNAREPALSQAEELRLRNRVRLLRGLAHMNEAFREADMRRLRSAAEQLQPLVVGEQVAWKWLPLYGLFVSAAWLGDAVFLLPDLLAMKQQALQEQDRATAIAVMCWIAAALLYGGHLRLLHQECLQAQGLLEQAGMQVAVGAYPTFDLSFLYYERNQLQKAETCLRSVMEHAQSWQDMQLLAWSYGVYVKVLLASGKLAEAEQALQEAQSLVQGAGLAAYEAFIMAAQVALWLAQGNLSAAGAWAELFLFNPDAPEYLRQEEYLALARVYLAQRQYERCLRLLAPLLSHMERMKRHWDVVHLLALQTIALSGLGETSQACQVAMRLLELTRPEGYLRVYLDAGEPMRRVLETLLAAPHEVISTSAVSRLLAAFKQEQGTSPFTQGVRTPDPSGNSAQSSTSVAQSPFDPLSPQERRVFHLLIAGRTYAEIAQELIVSLNTVKTQVSSIYRKLGVSRRAEASAVARQLQLL